MVKIISNVKGDMVSASVELAGDDIADLLRRGTPKDIIKSLLEEMEA